MTEFYPVFAKVIVLFTLLLIGYVARKINIFNDDVTKGLTSILVKVTLPAMIISSMQKKFSMELLKESSLLLGISFSVYAVSFILALLIPFLLKPRSTDKGVFQFMIMFSNVGFMGFPVLKAILGDEALFYAAIYNLPFNILTFTIGVYLLSSGHRGDDKFEFHPGLIINPGVVSVIIGFILFLFSIELPGIIAEPVTLLGDMTIPLSMFSIGAMLTRVPHGHLFTNFKVYAVSFIRLLVIPLTIWLILRNFIDNKLILGVVVLIPGMPAGASTPILAQEYGGNSDLGAHVVFLSTLLSVFTIPILAMVL